MNSRAHWLAAILGIATLWICGSVQAAEVRALLDRDNMQLGETVTLNVEVSGEMNVAQPDFSALQQDFNVLGTQSSSSVSSINGQTTAKTIWAIGLEPKHAGSLTIPALSVAGATTQPVTLTVAAAAGGTAKKAGEDIFVNVNATPLEPYVQQQIQLTVKLYYALNFADGKLFDPQGDGLVIRKLGQDSNYTAEANGRRYRVLERHYAIASEKSGAVTLAPLVFRGRAIDPNDFNSFFSRGREVAVQSDPIALSVRTRPATYGSDAWLPAQSLSLRADGIDANAEMHVGEPLTLTLKLDAQGLGFEQLPELKFPKIDGADVYPDKETTQNRDDGSWLHGTRERKFAIVPNRAGTLVIPAVSLGWWDTAHDQAANAEVPAEELKILPIAGAVTKLAAAAPPEPARDPATTTANVPAPVPAPIDSAELGKWRALALIALALWTLTLAAWIVSLLLQRRRAGAAVRDTKIVSADDGKGQRALFLAACAREDLAAVARTLLAWSRVFQSRVRNLGELARVLKDSAQSELVVELERVLYGGGDGNALGARLAKVFKHAPEFINDPDQAPDKSPLPPLYPFRV